MNIEKKKKRLEEIVQEIKQNEKQYEKLIEEGRKAIEVREIDDKTTGQIILEAGIFLQEHNLEQLDRICARLKRDFKGVIKSPGYIQNCCPIEWRQTKHSGVKGKSKISPRAAYRKAVEDQQLTEYEKQFVQVHEEKVKCNEHMEALIDYYLGLTEQEKTDIIYKIPKGSDYQKALIEKAKDNMLKIAKRLNDADIGPNLNGISFLGKIHAVYTEIVYNELQLRKRNKEMIGK